MNAFVCITILVIAVLLACVMKMAQIIRRTKEENILLTHELKITRENAKQEKAALEKAMQEVERNTDQLQTHVATQNAALIKRPDAISLNTPQPAKSASFPEKLTGNNAFANHVVAFTGTLPGMKRHEAIQAVRQNGGKAFADVMRDTTLLVVGNKPGANKLAKVSTRPSCRKITAQEFFVMLHQPLTFEPNEFESFIKSRLANNNA